MSSYYYNGELYHHGVAGQKWGVQNGPPYPLDSGVSKSNATRKYDTGKITGKIKSAASSVKNKVSSIGKSKNKNQDETKKKKINEMSDQELKKAVDRLNLENQYYTLSGKVASATESKGHKYVSQFMSKATNSVIDAATSAIGSKVKNYLNDALDVNGNKAKQAAKEAEEKRASDAAKKAEKKAAKAQAKAEANDVKDGKYRTIGGNSKQSTSSSTKNSTNSDASSKKSSNTSSLHNNSHGLSTIVKGVTSSSSSSIKLSDCTALVPYGKEATSSGSSTKLSSCTALVPYGEDYVKKHSK